MTEKTSAPKRKTAAAKAPVARGAVAKKPVAEKPAKPGKKAKKAADGHAGGKVKVVRDSFTMPQGDYAKLAELKQTCLKAGLQVKKSELLRAGLNVLCDLSVAQLKLAITRMEQIKTGRPKKN
jgi:hypothetical protein